MKSDEHVGNARPVKQSEGSGKKVRLAVQVPSYGRTLTPGYALGKRSSLISMAI